LPTLLHLYRLACRPCRAAESCIPGNHRIRRRHRETRNRSRRGTRRPSPSCASFISPGPGIGLPLAALCTAHISRLSAQSCTNEKSPPVLRPRITATNHYYLEEIGFDPQKREQATPTCVHPRRLCPETKPPRLRLASSRRIGSLFFLLHPGSLLPRRPHPFAWICDPCPKTHKLKTAATCRSPDN
jgi:hypothetical protein